MPAGEKGDHDLLDDFALADDDFAQFASMRARPAIRRSAVSRSAAKPSSGVAGAGAARGGIGRR
jgi:hypothetical protein